MKRNNSSKMRTNEEHQSYSVINFIKNLMKKNSSENDFQQIEISQLRKQSIKNDLKAESFNSLKKASSIDKQSGNKNDILLMSDYYNPQDIKFEEIKHFYKEQLLGPSVKIMEINKRVAIAQQLWKKPVLSKEEIEREILSKQLDQIVFGEDRQSDFDFFDPNYRNYIIKRGYLYDEEYSIPTQNLQKAIEFCEQNGSRKSAITAGSNLSFHTSKNVVLPERKLQSLHYNQMNIQNSSQSQQQKHTFHHQKSSKSDISSADMKNTSIQNGIQKEEVQKTHHFRNSIRKADSQKLLVLNFNNQSNQKNKEAKSLKVTNKSAQFGFKQANTSPKNQKGIIKTFSSQKDVKNSQVLSPGTENNSIIQIKEPNNFDSLLFKNQYSQKHSKSVFCFPELKEMKLNIEAFPQIAAKIQSIDQEQGTNNTTAISGFGQKQSKTIDIYKYAEEKQIFSQSQYADKDSQMTSTPLITSPSSQKLNLILNCLNTKLKQSKRFSHSSLLKNGDTNQMSSTIGLDPTKRISSQHSSSLSQTNIFYQESRPLSNYKKLAKQQSSEQIQLKGYFDSFQKKSKNSLHDFQAFSSNGFGSTNFGEEKNNLFSTRSSQNRFSVPSLLQNSANEIKLKYHKKVNDNS